MWLMIAGVLISSCSKTEPDKSAADSNSTPQAAASVPAVQSAAGYTLGTLISFGGANNSQAYRVSGWSQPEVGFTWTEGTTAVLRFGGLPTGESLQMKANLTGLTKAPQLVSQPVEVYANGQKVGDWNVIDKKEYSVAIPAAANNMGGTLTIELRIPKATSPKALGLSTDPRILGLCVFDVTIEKSA
jgi:hypothetical protein